MSKYRVPIINSAGRKNHESANRIELAGSLALDRRADSSIKRHTRIPEKQRNAESTVVKLQSEVRLLREEVARLRPQAAEVSNLNARSSSRGKYFYTPGHSRIFGTGIHVPEQRVTSSELFELFDSKNRFDIPYDWLERTMGIRERRMSTVDTLPSQMAFAAACDALEHAAVLPAEIDVIVYAGITRDYVEPASAHVVQDKLQARNAIAFDVTNACHGFMNAIHLVDALIGLGQARYGLIVTGEQLSRGVRKTVEMLKRTNDRAVFKNLAGALTLGDAGAAMVLGPKSTAEAGFMGCMLQSRGEYSGLCVYGARGEESSPLITDMPTIVKTHLQMHAEMYPESMLKFGWEPSQIRKFVHHQVSIRAFKMHSQYSDVPVDLMSNSISTMGNLATASIPLNLHNLSLNRELADGDKIFVAGAGSGLSISQAAFVWEQTV